MTTSARCSTPSATCPPDSALPRAPVYDELGIDDIAETLSVSRNSVKTHLQRGLAALEARFDRGPRGGVVSTLEERLREALHDGAVTVEESPDLFARVELSIHDDQRLACSTAASSLSSPASSAPSAPSRSPSPKPDKGVCSWTGGYSN